MKSIKVMYNGKRMKDIYPYATKWQVFKYKTMKFIRKLIFWSILLTVLVFTIRYAFPKVEYSIVEKQVVIDNLSEKVNQLKGELIADIKKGESLGKVDCDSMITFDPNVNNKKVEIPSLGCYQYKVSTVQHYYKKLYNQDITRKEAILVAMDENKAGELTRDIVFKEKGGLDNWYNTSKKYDLYNKLAIINKLTQ